MSRGSAVTRSARFRIILIFLVSVVGCLWVCVGNATNDPTTRRTGRHDSNHDAPAGLCSSWLGRLSLFGCHIVSGARVELSLNVFWIVNALSVHKHIPVVQFIPVIIPVNSRMR